ncbi:MAG: hypothetical protein AVDCRST_MAG30-783 [uncultured Solirubrobacteraceae bacterium]|uniref:Uncharacterized protein n=1 Tax=uncultured Solirubrobacteraceae bacterium TaxID=1162706 RepID=A0A6J4RTT0_9ACTN|nr:MAG: hypothetical protein AVDCRST_MAG30-783 [uncultured Solirubrobacteraceae bacterium]
MEAATVRDGTIRALPREIPALVEGFRRHDLLLFASAISFQVLTAIVPLLLFGFGLLGFLNLTEVWEGDLRPQVESAVSPAALTVIDDTVGRVLGSKQLVWVTFGAALATWQLSGAIRAAMEALNRVQGVEETRGWPARFTRSLLLAIGECVLLLLAISVVTLGPLLYGDAGSLGSAGLLLVRWVLAAALVLLAVGLLVRHGPDCPQPLGWVSVGAGLVVGGWLAMSAAFLVYLTTIAAYGSLFGNLATLVVLMGYLYASSITFLGGIMMDALLRDRHAGDPSGSGASAPEPACATS